MRLNPDNYFEQGRPRIFLNGEELEAKNILWSDDELGQVYLIDELTCSSVMKHGVVTYLPR
jgi:hypothetical protein